MLSFQRECQRRANEQIKSDMNRFRERELSSMRLECENRMQDEAGKSRRQFEAFYQERLKALQLRERNLMENMKQRETQLDATLFTQRQKILDELVSVKNRETETRRLLETENSGVRGEKERLMCLEQNLKLRELSIENISKQKDIAIQGELAKRQIELEREYEDKLKHIQIQEATLREEKRSLSQLEGICSHQIKETADLRTQLYKLQEAVHISTESQLTAEKDKHILADRLGRMGDYDELKSETLRLENELFVSRHELGKSIAIHDERMRDYQTQISVLRSQLQQPSSEVHELRNTFAHEKHGFERDRIMMQQENIQLQQQLETADHQQRCLKETLRDNQLLVRQLNQELSDLRVKSAGNKTRANRDVTQFDSNPMKSSLRPHTHSGTMDTPTKEQPDLLHKPKSNRVRIKLPATDTVFNETADFSTASSEISFVQEAKASLERLEREAQQLELSYKQVHSRILRGTDSQFSAIDFSQDKLYTSTIDPKAYLPVISEYKQTQMDNHMSLSSLSSINLTAGVNQSPLGILEKSTDIISPLTTQDNIPSLPSITQLLSLPTHTSLLSDNRNELSMISEVTSDSPKLLLLEQSPNKSLDPIKLFHELQNSESLCSQDSIGTHQSVAPTPVESSLSAGMQPNSAGMQPDSAGMQPNSAGMQPNSAGMQPNSAGMQPDSAAIQSSESKLPFHDTHIQDVPITSMVANLSFDVLNRVNTPSLRAIARGEALREAIEESERIEEIQTELEQLQSIPMETDMRVNPIEEVDSIVIPNSVSIPTEPIDKRESTIIPSATPILTLIDNPTEPIEKLESTIIPSATPILTQLDNPTEPIDKQESTIIPSITAIQLDTPVVPKETEQTIDPMARYMQLLTSDPEREHFTLEANDDVTTGLDISLKSVEPAVSFGAFSDAEKSDPFADW